MLRLIFKTPNGERSIIAKSGKPSHIRAALRLAGEGWILTGAAEH